MELCRKICVAVFRNLIIFKVGLKIKVHHVLLSLENLYQQTQLTWLIRYYGLTNCCSDSLPASIGFTFQTLGLTHHSGYCTINHNAAVSKDDCSRWLLIILSTSMVVQPCPHLKEVHVSDSSLQSEEVRDWNITLGTLVV